LGLLLYIASKPLITLSTKAFFLSGVEQSTKKSPDQSEALSTTNIKTATNIEVNLITDMLDWIKNSPQSIYALLGDYGMGKTFSCKIKIKLPLCACWMKVCASVVTSCRLKTLCIISSKYG
jgi:hypothetical protein